MEVLICFVLIFSYDFFNFFYEGCKVPQKQLLELLSGISSGKVGMDCSVVKLRQKDLYMVSTVDFFYPSVDDPFAQGKIACANVLSDLYSFGISECDNMLMIMGLSRDMAEAERFIVSREIIKGFNELAEKEGGTEVTGGQTVLNPWPIIGGVAMSVVSKDEFILPVNARPGNIIILTKPLGTQLAVNLHQWLKTGNTDKIEGVIHKLSLSDEDVSFVYHFAMLSMSKLNRHASRLMMKHQALAATDVTGFGIMGHAQNLAENQNEKVDFILHSLPCIPHTPSISTLAPGFRFHLGYSAETSGGLFICLENKQVALDFIADLSAIDPQWPAYIIGDVVPASGPKNTAKFSDDIRFFEVETDP